MNSQSHDFRKLLLKGNSRSYTDFVVDIVNKRPELISELWDIFLSIEEPVSRRAAWAIDIATEEKPDWVIPFLPKLVDSLSAFDHDGYKRHGLKLISRVPFAPDSEGVLMDLCFKWLLSPVESVAVKMYCMIILYRISQKESDILQELFDTIEFQLPNATPGFRNIGKKMMIDIDRDLLQLKTTRK